MHCEIINRYFNVFFFLNSTEKKKLENYFLGARVWVPELVYRSPRWLYMSLKIPVFRDFTFFSQNYRVATQVIAIIRIPLYISFKISKKSGFDLRDKIWAKLGPML